MLYAIEVCICISIFVVFEAVTCVINQVQILASLSLLQSSFFFKILHKTNYMTSEKKRNKEFYKVLLIS